MTTDSWSREDLDLIGQAEEIEIITIRQDGSPRKPVPLWVVRHDRGLYVRSGYGVSAAWYRATQQNRVGHVRVGGKDRPVTFVAGDPALDAALNAALDALYRAKYGHDPGPYVAMSTSSQAHATTLELRPRRPMTDDG